MEMIDNRKYSRHVERIEFIYFPFIILNLRAIQIVRIRQEWKEEGSATYILRILSILFCVQRGWGVALLVYLPFYLMAT